MNFSLNIHRVIEILVEPAEEKSGSYGIYATRTIKVITKEGDFELTLFSERVEESHTGELLQIKS